MTLIDKDELELYRAELIWNQFYSFEEFLEDDFNNLYLYLEKIGSLIERAKSRTLKRLHRRARKVPQEQKDHLWERYYPQHIDAVADQFPSSVVIWAFSVFEQNLNGICRDVAMVARVPITASRRKSLLDNARSFLFGRDIGFRKPSPAEWEQLSRIYDVRNVIVHNCGVIKGSRQEERLTKFINAQKNIVVEDGCLKIHLEFCKDMLDAFKIFLSELCSQGMLLCRRIES